MSGSNNSLQRDVAITALSIFLALVLTKTGVLNDLFASTQEWRFVGSFLAGMFFVSLFTAAPAGVVLFEIALATPAWEVALFGGLGALAGDWIMFRFIRNNLTNNVGGLMKKKSARRLALLMRRNPFRWLVPLVGAFIVASPLPDEIGLAMMGLSKVKSIVFIPVSFILNFLGILIIGLIANGLT